jgi:hypothetical protein
MAQLMLIPTTPPAAEPVCTVMPSAEAARSFVLGTPGSIVPLFLSYLGRTSVVAAGMAAAGKRDHLLRDAAAGTAVVELGLLAYFSIGKNQNSSDIPTQQHIADLLQGKSNALLPVLIDVAVRTLEIAGGMALAGSKKDNLKYAIAGSLSVEALILMYSIAFGVPCQMTEP